MNKEIKILIKKDKEILPKNKLKRLFYILTNHNAYVIYKSFKYFRKYNYYKEKNNYIMMVIYGRLKNKIIQKYNIELPTKIGTGIDIPHRNVVINRDAVIGNDVKLHGFNVIGNDGKSPKAPVIGNNVDIGVGSIIIGDVYIADDCVIGANSLVNKSFYEKGSVIVGSPAKVIKIKKVENF